MEALSRDYTRADLSPSDRLMLDHAVKLTRAPATVVRNDVEKLRSLGFSDSALLDLTLVVAYFAFVNRLAEGLGVELEPRWG